MSTCGVVGAALAAVAMVTTGCLTAADQPCADGTLCALDQVCWPAGGGCVDPDVLVPCRGLADGTSCSLDGVDGECQGEACIIAVCGNGVVELTEVCDDGNRLSGDGCSGTCSSDERCGNGIPEGNEGCDCGDATHPGPPSCGDTFNGGERCDLACVRPGCGDGNLDVGEACDAGAANSDEPDAACRTNCQLRRCSDGIVDALAGEVCDDGNLSPDDGCAYDCGSDETCGNGVVDFFVGETCDDGNAVSFDGCSRACVFDEMTWIEHGTSPPPRARAAMALDPRRGEVVAFGGWTSGDMHGDTWVWDGGGWVPRAPAHAPSARRAMVATYDAARGRVVAFGGDADFESYADTWEWDGTDWRDVTPALPPATPRGVSLGALRDVATSRGLRAFAVPGELALLRHELEAGRPVIVGLLRPVPGGGLNHFEVVVALTAADRIATIDPADGWLVRPWTGFDAEWQAVGRPALVVLGPPATTP